MSWYTLATRKAMFDDISQTFEGEKPAILMLFAHFFDDSFVRASWLEYDKFRVPIGVRTVELSLIHSMLGKFGMAFSKHPWKAWKKRLAVNMLGIIWGDMEDIKTPSELLQPFLFPRIIQGKSWAALICFGWMLHPWLDLSLSSVEREKHNKRSEELEIITACRFSPCVYNQPPKSKPPQEWTFGSYAHVLWFYKQSPSAPQPSSYTPEAVYVDSDFGGAKAVELWQLEWVWKAPGLPCAKRNPSFWSICT